MITKVSVQSEGKTVGLVSNGTGYSADGIEVKIDGGAVYLDSPEKRIERIILDFDDEIAKGARVYSDAWERSYADLQWTEAENGFISPWYFMAYDGEKTVCCGVKTRPNALVYWKYSGGKLQMICDVRCGAVGVQLEERLHAADIVMGEYSGEPFDAAREFCRKMCEKAIFPKAPVYGGNDWYCNYGNNSYEKIIRHAEVIAECSRGLENRPYMVVDAGWQMCFVGQFTNVEIMNCGPWRYCNCKFGDMKKLADEIKSMDIHPGIWLRPLLTAEFVPDEYYIKAADGGKLSDEYILKNNLYRTMDPSEPFVLAKIAEDVKTLADWGYELIKFDFTTLDLMHRPGSAWGEDFTDGGWTFGDKSKTTAQILKNMYKTIREAAGENAIVIGCNTIGHLGTGYFEMQRTGGDTSGDEWDRTRRMGVNTLAFRMPQHGIFYDIDADCVGITKNITWQQNREWLRLLSVSGTPLFVSVAEDAYNDDVKAALTEAFEKAEKNTVPARPADWFDTKIPARWETAFGEYKFNWHLE